MNYQVIEIIMIIAMGGSIIGVGIAAIVKISRQGKKKSGHSAA